MTGDEYIESIRSDPLIAEFFEWGSMREESDGGAVRLLRPALFPCNGAKWHVTHSPIGRGEETAVETLLIRLDEAGAAERDPWETRFCLGAHEMLEAVRKLCPRADLAPDDDAIRVPFESYETLHDLLRILAPFAGRGRS